MLQVWNLQGAIKVASDFISATNLPWTARMLTEWREARLTTRKADVLQLRTTLWLQWLASQRWPDRRVSGPDRVALPGARSNVNIGIAAGPACDAPSARGVQAQAVGQGGGTVRNDVARVSCSMDRPQRFRLTSCTGCSHANRSKQGSKIHRRVSARRPRPRQRVWNVVL